MVPLAFPLYCLFFVAFRTAAELTSVHYELHRETVILHVNVCVKQPLNWFEFGLFCVHSQSLEQPHQEAKKLQTTQNNNKNTSSMQFFNQMPCSDVFTRKTVWINSLGCLCVFVCESVCGRPAIIFCAVAIFIQIVFGSCVRVPP